MLDGPLRMGGWSPADFEPGWRGEVSLEQALALSLNTAAVRLEMQYGGPGAVAGVAHRLGVTGKLPDLPSLALGTGEVGLLDMTSAYAAFFNGGRAVTTACHPVRHGGRQAGRRALGRPQAGDRSGPGGHDGADDGGSGPARRHRRGGGGAWPLRGR